MVGGHSANTHLWISDINAASWRKSMPLPYGPGETSYGATLVAKDGRVFLTGGHRDPEGTQPAGNADKIYELVPNSHFREVAADLETGGAAGAAAVVVPKIKED